MREQGGVHQHLVVDALVRRGGLRLAVEEENRAERARLHQFHGLEIALARVQDFGDGNRPFQVVLELLLELREKAGVSRRPPRHGPQSSRSAHATCSRRLHSGVSSLPARTPAPPPLPPPPPGPPPGAPAASRPCAHPLAPVGRCHVGHCVRSVCAWAGGCVGGGQRGRMGAAAGRGERGCAPRLRPPGDPHKVACTHKPPWL